MSRNIITNKPKGFGSGGIRTHAPEETGALNQRLRPLGHATLVLNKINKMCFISQHNMKFGHPQLRRLIDTKRR